MRIKDQAALDRSLEFFVVSRQTSFSHKKSEEWRVILSAFIPVYLIRVYSSATWSVEHERLFSLYSSVHAISKTSHRATLKGALTNTHCISDTNYAKMFMFACSYAFINLIVTTQLVRLLHQDVTCSGHYKVRAGHRVVILERCLTEACGSRS